MRDDRERFRAFLAATRSVDQRHLDSLRESRRSVPRSQALPALALAVLTVLLTTTAAVILSRVGDREPQYPPASARGAASGQSAPIGRASPPAVAGLPSPTTAARIVPTTPATTASGPTVTPPMPAEATAIATASISARGSIAFVTDQKIYVRKVNGSSERIGIVTKYNPDGGPSGLGWSPDGRRLVYSDIQVKKDEDGGYSNDILVVNADGTGMRRLTGEPYHEYRPAWSPDGRRIAYSTLYVSDDTRDIPPPDIWTMKADGSGKGLLVKNGYAPAWSPDGRQLAFASDDRGIHVVNADGTGRTRLAATRNDDFEPAWSPDGAWIAFRRGHYAESGQIYLMDANGREVVRLTNGKDDLNPTWSPDSKYIAFVRQYLDRGQSRIVILDLLTRTERVLEDAVEPAWAP